MSESKIELGTQSSLVFLTGEFFRNSIDTNELLDMVTMSNEAH